MKTIILILALWIPCSAQVAMDLNTWDDKKIEQEIKQAHVVIYGMKFLGGVTINKVKYINQKEADRIVLNDKKKRNLLALEKDFNFKVVEKTFK